jgi:hypothetical protein
MILEMGLVVAGLAVTEGKIGMGGELQSRGFSEMRACLMNEMPVENACRMCQEARESLVAVMPFCRAGRHGRELQEK